MFNLPIFEVRHYESFGHYEPIKNFEKHEIGFLRMYCRSSDSTAIGKRKHSLDRRVGDRLAKSLLFRTLKQ